MSERQRLAIGPRYVPIFCGNDNSGHFDSVGGDRIESVDDGDGMVEISFELGWIGLMVLVYFGKEQWVVDCRYIYII